MIGLLLLLQLSLPGQVSAAPLNKPPSDSHPLEKSAYFAFVDHDYIFTIEAVKPGVLLLNFVSMADADIKLVAKNIMISLENHKTPAKLLNVETGDFRQPMSPLWLTIHPRSSFGVRLSGDFGNATEIFGATIRLGDEILKLAPLTSADFEFLVLKVNRINLGSPDFSEDWQVLRLQKLGSRSPARK